MISKRILIFFIITTLLFPSIALSNTVSSSTCKNIKEKDNFIILCNNVDDIICRNVPVEIRRSCDKRDHSIVHAGMTANEVYHFAKGCLKSGAESFVSFFTEFLPDLVKAIWNLTKSAYHKVTEPGLIDSIKGAYESARSITADVYEAVHENPGAFFNGIWNKITDAVGPAIASYDCLNPQAKVEKICGLIAEWVVPPAVLAKVIVGGPKAVKALMALKAVSKEKNIKVSEAILSFTKKQKKVYRPHPIPAEKNKTIFAGMVELNKYKLIYAEELKLPKGSNANFIRLMEEDAKGIGQKIYFDVENSVQKTLNDTVFVDKHAVDAINNSFFKKFYTNLRLNKELMERLEGEYKDYKSFRLRLNLRPGDDPKKYEQMLAELYSKTNNEFSDELAKRQIAQKIAPRNDGLNITTGWFLAGAGDSALDANMAARAVRSNRNNQLSLFRNHTEKLTNEISSIEKLRAVLSSDKVLLDAKIMELTNEGKAIPSKPLLNILRKTKPEDFATEQEFINQIRLKANNTFGVELTDQHITNLANYFKKVDALSPPLYSAERTIINLDEAKHGIVSIDFAGVGVDNISQQMKALSESTKTLHESFIRMQRGIDEVSKDMNHAKNTFTNSVSKVEGKNGAPQFSGDDGIYMPLDKSWNGNDKLGLVKELARTEDPSKFRVTFVESHYSNGEVIPTANRSKYIVRAETLEKDVRSKFTGASKIPDEEAKKIITAIDYAPAENGGGVFNVIISGKDFTKEEIDLIRKSVESSLEKDAQEHFGSLIFK